MAFFHVRRSRSPPAEDAAMRIAGWSVEDSSARLAVLPALAVAGCVMWLLLPQASDAESQDLMIGRITLHQKTIWMLRSFLKG